MTPSSASLSQSCLAFVLAGGRGSRLHELTERDCKPAIPFAGSSRIVDFVLANTLNSGIRQVLVATQYQPQRLVSHLRNRWEPRFATREGRLIAVGSGSESETTGYRGTADAVYRNIDRIDSLAPRHVLVLAADHVYQMDYNAMLEEHADRGADVTIAVDVVPRREASAFGVIATDAEARITGFQEKPSNPTPLPEDPNRVMASMGIYVFDWQKLRAMLIADARDPSSSHDFGKDILPRLAAGGKAFVHRFSSPQVNGRSYWRDVGTIDALHAAHMDLLLDPEALDVSGWPLHVGWVGRVGEVAGAGSPCLVYPGSEAIGAHLHASSLGPLVSVAPGAKVEKSILMTGSSLGADVRLRRVILAPGTRIEGPFSAGFDLEEDEQWFRRSRAGILLIDQAMVNRRQAEHRPAHPIKRPALKMAAAPVPPRAAEMLTFSKIR